MSSNKSKFKTLFKSTLFIGFITTAFVWIIIYIIWAQYPQRLMQGDLLDSNQWNQSSWIQNEWNGVPYKIPDPSELKGNSQYNSMGEKYGTYGDMYGSLNTLFSGFAFATLIISLILQMLELHAQRKEIQESNSIADEQRKIASKQGEITEQQKVLNEQQIHDAKVQNFYTLLFKFLDEKRRKINEIEDQLTGSNSRKYNPFDLFIYAIEDDLVILNEHILDNHLNVENSDLIDVLHRSITDYEEKRDNKIVKSEFFDFTRFILNFIEDHEYLGVSEQAIEIFISYQSFNEMYSMFLYSIYDETLQNYIIKYSLLRKLNAYHRKSDYLKILADNLIGESSYSP